MPGKLILKGNACLYQRTDGSSTLTQLIDAGTGEWVGPVGPNTVVTGDIQDAAVTYAKIQNVAGLSVVGRSANSSGVSAAITGTDGQVLRVSGTTLGFGEIATAGLANNAVTSAKLALNTIQNATVTINNAATLDLFDTPITLVAAGGANTVIVLESLVLKYVFATGAFTIGSATNLQVKYTNGSGTAASATCSVTGFLDQGADELRVIPVNSSSVEPVANSPLVLHLAGADVTGGGGSLVAYIRYSVQSVA